MRAKMTGNDDHRSGQTSAIQNAVTDATAPKEEGNLRKSIACTLVVCMGTFLAGAVWAYPSPSIPDLDDHTNRFHVDPEQISWLGSVVCLGALAGGPIGGLLMDKVGRKLTLMTFTCPFSMACVVMVASPNFPCLVFGFSMTGFCIGVYTLVCPVYVVEIAPASIRGLLASCTQLSIFLGSLFVYVLGAFLSWTWLAVSISVVNLALVFALVFVPETPRWLLSKGRRDDAEFALKWLRGEEVDVRQELDALQVLLKSTGEKFALKEFRHPQLLKPLLISLGLMVLKQLCGISIIMVYTVQIFQMSKCGLDPILQTIVVGIVGVIGAVVSLAVSDFVGRKALLLVSGLLMTLAMGSIGAFFHVQDANGSFAASVLAWLPLVCLMTFIFGYSVAFGPIPWVIMSELLPLRAKGVASAIAVAVHWLLAFVISKFFMAIVKQIHPYGGFWICAGFCALSLPFIVFCVPETKGKTLEELQNDFN